MPDNKALSVFETSVSELNKTFHQDWHAHMINSFIQNVRRVLARLNYSDVLSSAVFHRFNISFLKKMFKSNNIFGLLLHCILSVVLMST